MFPDPRQHSKLERTRSMSVESVTSAAIYKFPQVCDSEASAIQSQQIVCDNSIMASQQFQPLQRGVERPNPPMIGGAALNMTDRMGAIVNGQMLRMEQELARTQQAIDEARKEMDRTHNEMMTVLDYVHSEVYFLNGAFYANRMVSRAIEGLEVLVSESNQKGNALGIKWNKIVDDVKRAESMSDEQRQRVHAAIEAHGLHGFERQRKIEEAAAESRLMTPARGNVSFISPGALDMVQIPPNVESAERPPLPPPADSPRDHASTQFGGLVPGSVAGKNTVAMALAAGVTPGQLVDQQLALELGGARGREQEQSTTRELKRGDSYTGRERKNLFDNRKEIVRGKSPVPKRACTPARRSSSRNKIPSPTSPVYSGSEYSYDTSSDDRVDHHSVRPLHKKSSAKNEAILKSAAEVVQQSAAERGRRESREEAREAQSNTRNEFNQRRAATPAPGNRTSSRTRSMTAEDSERTRQQIGMRNLARSRSASRSRRHSRSRYSRSNSDSDNSSADRHSTYNMWLDPKVIGGSASTHQQMSQAPSGDMPEWFRGTNAELDVAAMLKILETQGVNRSMRGEILGNHVSRIADLIEYERSTGRSMPSLNAYSIRCSLCLYGIKQPTEFAGWTHLNYLSEGAFEVESNCVVAGSVQRHPHSGVCLGVTTVRCRTPALRDILYLKLDGREGFQHSTISCCPAGTACILGKPQDLETKLNVARPCRMLLDPPAIVINQDSGQGAGTQDLCLFCGVRGHWKRECPALDTEKLLHGYYRCETCGAIDMHLTRMCTQHYTYGAGARENRGHGGYSTNSRNTFES